MRARDLAPAAAALAVVAGGAASWPFTVDDAWVVARYAARLAAGRGYTMNDGAPTDGVTGPLWLVPGVLARAASVGPIAAQKVVGLALAALALALAVRAAGRAQGGRVAVWAALVAGAAGPVLGPWGAGGLETGAATLALTAATFAALARPAPRGVASGVAIFALAWLRPECAPAALAVLAIVAARGGRGPAWRASGVALAGVATVVAFRLAMFGHALPMSLAAKPALPGHGLAYAARAVVLALPTAGVALAAWRGSMRDRAVAAVIAMHVVAVVLAGGDWMPGFRLLAPAVPLAAWLTGRAVARLARRRRVLAAIALFAAVTLPALDLGVTVVDARATVAPREAGQRALAAWLASHAHRVALVDVGRLAFESSVEVVDLGGITEPHVAYAPGGHLAKRLDEAWLRARAPDVIVLHAAVPPRVSPDGRLRSLLGWPVERRVASFRFVRDGFRVARVVPVADDYVYVVLARPSAAGLAGSTE